MNIYYKNTNQKPYKHFVSQTFSERVFKFSPLKNMFYRSTGFRFKIETNTSDSCFSKKMLTVSFLKTFNDKKQKMKH